MTNKAVIKLRRRIAIMEGEDPYWWNPYRAGVAVLGILVFVYAIQMWGIIGGGDLNGNLILLGIKVAGASAVAAVVAANIEPPRTRLVYMGVAVLTVLTLANTIWFAVL